MYMHLFLRRDHPSERISPMRKPISLLVVLVLGAGLLAYFGKNRPTRVSADQTQSVSSRPELEYLKAVNRTAPPKDPQLLFLLMAAFANTNQQADGVEFLSARLNEFAPRLTDVEKSLYHSAIALLRAQNAASI